MSAPFASLSEENHESIRKYLKFFRQKKDSLLRDIQREINDVNADRLNEDMYTREDVMEFADFLASAIKSQLSGDIATMINMSALAIDQLFQNAQDKGVQLALETSSLEDQQVLEAIEKMSLDAIPRAAKKTGALTSFKDEAKAFRDQSHQLEETNNRLLSEIDNLRRRLQSAEKEYRTFADSKMAEDSRGKASSRELERALEEAKEENQKRVAETSQFQTMRKMMQSQAAKIRDLRQRLNKYEPDACKEDDF